MSDRRAYSDDIKAAAMADLLTGDQPAVVAERYGVRPGTVRQWKMRLEVTPSVTNHVTDAVTVVQQRPTIEERQARIGSLIIEVLEARLEAQLAITKHVSTNGTWINNQTAADLATLDGHLHRTAVDVLDRLAAAHRSSATNNDESGDGA